MEVEGDLVIVDGWQFEIDRNVPKIVDELGKLTSEEMLKPIITSFRTIIKETEIQVKIKLRNEEGRNIVYTINEIKENDEKVNIETSNSLQELEYTFKNLKKGQEYEIKVETSNEYGKDSKERILETQKPILISKIVFDKEEENIFVNSKKILNYKIEPENATNKEISWTTSDNTIATVENGEITPIKNGSCIITATALDEGKINATCKINIVNGISTVEELISVKNNSNGNYILLNNIELQGIDWNPINVHFSGTFDGNGYTISNLNKPLFAAIQKGTVKNLKLENVQIDYEDNYVGALARGCYQGGTIENIGVTGSIKGKYYTSGLIRS